MLGTIFCPVRPKGLFRVFVLIMLSYTFQCFETYHVFRECNPNTTIVDKGMFVICVFKSNFSVELDNVSDVFQFYTKVSHSFALNFELLILRVQGAVQFEGKGTLPNIQVKRNQFPSIISGLPNHQFGYIIFGTLNISDSRRDYTLCSRSDDG